MCLGRDLVNHMMAGCHLGKPLHTMCLSGCSGRGRTASEKILTCGMPEAYNTRAWMVDALTSDVAMQCMPEEASQAIASGGTIDLTGLIDDVRRKMIVIRQQAPMET